MIITSSYNNCKSNKYNTYSISGDRGREANYKGLCYPKLAPKKEFWKIWHDNIDEVPEEENNRYYIQEYYKQVLSQLDPEQVYNELDNSILLCYEGSYKFCHRHIVAAWFELLLDVKVPEKKVYDNCFESDSRPLYIKQYLEEVMKENRDMKGFNSLRALYLFEKSEKLKIQAKRIEKEMGLCQDIIRERIYSLENDAYEIENKYNQQMKGKSLS